MVSFSFSVFGCNCCQFLSTDVLGRVEGCTDVGHPWLRNVLGLMTLSQEGFLT